MKKKTLLLVAAILVLCLAMAACAKNEDKGIEPEPTPTEVAAPTDVPEPTPDVPADGGTPDPDNTGDDNAEPEKFLGTDTADVETMYNAIVELLGEDYVANMAFDETSISELFGIQSDWYDGIVAEGPMISMHVDKLVIVKASEGHAEDVKAALDSYLETLQADTMQYPMNVPKIHGAVVDSFDNYVIFSLLGFVDDVEDEEAAIAAYQTINNEAIEAAKNSVAG